MCKSKRFPYTSSSMKQKKKKTIVMVEIYRLYVSECFLASKGGVPNKNSKQRMPRLHTSTPESCSLPSTETKQVRFLFQVSSQPSLSINLQEFISSFNYMYPFIKSTTKDVINIAHWDPVLALLWWEPYPFREEGSQECHTESCACWMCAQTTQSLQSSALPGT